MPWGMAGALALALVLGVVPNLAAPQEAVASDSGGVDWGEEFSNCSTKELGEGSFPGVLTTVGACRADLLNKSQQRLPGPEDGVTGSPVLYTDDPRDIWRYYGTAVSYVDGPIMNQVNTVSVTVDGGDG